MCTAVTFQSRDFYFGRNLDLYYNYQEEVTVTPRNFPFPFRNGKMLQMHHAMIGMATVSDCYPLYYEATNEQGLSMAGLNFPGNAVYQPFAAGKENVTPFELIPWILGQCANTDEALVRLRRTNLWCEPFSESFPLSPLHWMLADKHRCFVLEPLADGLKIHENPFGVLTNNPPFEFHRYNTIMHLNLTPGVPANRFSRDINLKPFSLGMGSIGLPGDPSSPSRFIKAAFTRLNSKCGQSEEESISQFFHILSGVAQLRGITVVNKDDYEYTLYSSCCNADKGIYYYTTYENSRITAIDMNAENIQGCSLIRYPLRKKQDVRKEN